APVGGIKRFDLSIEERTHTFFEGIKTRTFGIDADYLGPTLLLRRGEQVSIGYTNRLAEATTMHGHGMHLPASMDGGPHQIIRPGETWRAEYTVSQKACTNWYHPHYMGKTAEHVYKGLAGMIIVEDGESAALNLPNTYGVDDIPLVIQDRRFDANGQIDYSPSRMEIMQGYRGDTHIVNGVIEPTFFAGAGQLRLRLLNGSNAEVYRIGFDDNRSFSMIAGDNSFLEAPVTMNEVRLSPGERAEIVVDLSKDAGGSVILQERSRPGTLLQLSVSGDTGRTGPLPAKLSTLDRPDPAAAVRTRTFRLSGQMGRFYINGKSMDMDVINETVPLDAIEIWEVFNGMGMPHNFHIHATHFLLLERDGSAASVAESEKGYKDTVYLPPNGRVKLLVTMTDYSDAVNPYMYHCHFLEHEDAGMMGQFVTV
ncbi:MAG TPA: copper oxidase, partial [Sulfuricurvum sp.]|nr:copper oxidase [Sulfuricurvum sp.]